MNYICILACFFGIVTHLTIDTVEAIIGGKVTGIKHYRYIVSLLEVDYGHLCGGAIINPKLVLSAAHCFLWSDNTFKSKRVFALMGTSDLMKMGDPAFNTEVVKVYVPSEFDAGNINTTADIAVLRLKMPLQLGEYLDLKRLMLEKNRYTDHTGEKATFAGWGWNSIEYHGNHIAGYRTDSELRFASADILSHNQCQHEHTNMGITLDHMCAKLEQSRREIRGVCYGDDGGPLVHGELVIGVLSVFPNTCSEKITAAVYTRVSHYLTFIRNSKEDRVTKHMRAHVLST